MSGPLHYPSLGCERATSHPRKFLLHAFQIQTWVHFFSLLHFATLSEDDVVCCRIWFNACASLCSGVLSLIDQTAVWKSIAGRSLDQLGKDHFCPASPLFRTAAIIIYICRCDSLFTVSFHWQQLFQTSDNLFAVLTNRANHPLSCSEFWLCKTIKISERVCYWWW